MGWVAYDGTLEAPVANPAPNIVNSTANCGKYTKSGAHAYSLLLAERTTPFDMSILNQFKLQIHASAATQVLLKFEGAGGPAVEKTANIGLTNAWQEYTFDLSDAAAYTHLTKAILFFDPGVETSADVYHYDNFYALPKGACAGVTPNPLMIDDFECNRNATYVNGWDSLTVVSNPAPNAVNGSTKVGKYVDPAGEPWAALVADYQNPIDLSTNNQLNVKVHSPIVTKILFKLEGGSSPVKEVWQDVTTANQWIDYTIDFSGEALSSHKKVVLFFNAGQDGTPGDTYYIDDMSWGEKTVTDLENFENGAFLPWEPLDQQTLLHGAFAVVNNPSATGVNTSAKVGQCTKGASQFSTLAAVAPGVIDITTKPQFNLDVWAPIGATSVIMQLESPVEGNKEVSRNITNAGNWETLSFDFSNYQSITDWVSIKLLFNPGVAEEGAVYYFDNLRQGASTVDPCEGTTALTNIIDDFECQRNYAYGAQADFITAVNNPVVSTVNNSTKAGLYKDQPASPWAALCNEFPDGINLDVFNQLELQVLSTKVVPVLLKLEGGTDAPAEIWTEVSKANEWVQLSVDFSGQKGKNHKRVCYFLNGGVETTAVEDYYIDNIKWSHAPYDGCIMNFDDAAFTSTKWKYFPADESGGFELVDNPKKEGINQTLKVGKAIEKASGEQVWQGMYTDLDSYINFGNNTLIKMMLLSPKAGSVTMKVERPLVEGFPGGSGDNTVVNTKANEWEELTYDFSASPTPIDPAGHYARITLIFDIANLPSEDVIYYFDNIRLENGDCGQETAVFNTPNLASMEVSPNPTADVLKIKNTTNVSAVKIVNIYGQTMAKWQTAGQADQTIDVSNISTGTYMLIGLNSKNQAIARAKFVKL